MGLVIDSVGTIYLTRQDDQVLTFNVKDSAGAPLSLAGSTFFFTCKAKIDDLVGVFQKIVGSGITVEPGGVTGKLTVAVSSADVGVAGNYVVDLLMVDALGKRNTFPVAGAWRFVVPKNVSAVGGTPGTPTPFNLTIPGEVLAIGGYVLKDKVTGKFWLLTMINGVPDWYGPSDTYPV